jgi:UDP-glucose 4-epimerase
MTQIHSFVTGGAGFIGSHLTELLLAQGHRVTVLDDLSTGRYSNVGHLEGRPGFTLIIDSVRNEALVEELIRECDRVYHLASAVGVKLILEQPVKTIETIVGGTDVVLRKCSRFRKAVLVASTSEVYGKGTAVPFREDDDVMTGATSKHRWAYSCAKALDEFLALAHWRETRLPVAIARLFNTVGPRQVGQYGMVVPRFVQAALQNEPLTIYGDGEQTRCFAHVADIAGAIGRMLDTRECFGQVINLGNDREISINCLAQRTIALTHSRSEVCHIPYDEAYGPGFEDMQRRVPSLERARDLLGYEPRYGLEEIILDVAASFGAARAVAA